MHNVPTSSEIMENVFKYFDTCDRMNNRESEMDKYQLEDCLKTLAEIESFLTKNLGSIHYIRQQSKKFDK